VFASPLATAALETADKILEFIKWGGLIVASVGLLTCLLMMMIAGWLAKTTN
jgi:hypothetical protein